MPAVTLSVDRKIELFQVLGLTLGLVGFGSVMVLSATAAFEVDYFSRHLVAIFIGFFGLGVIYVMPLSFFCRHYKTFFLLAIVLAAATLLFGSEVNGAQRWLRIGGFSFQAAEWGKLLVGIYLCGYLANHQENIEQDPRLFLVPILMVSMYSGTLVLQPDLGSAVVLLLATYCLVFVVGMRLRYFLGILLLFSIVLFLLIAHSPYRLERVVAFFDPWDDPLDSGWQLTQALIAFGRGEWFGEGLGGSVQKLFYLPEAHNDFILAVIAEELGIIGCTFVFLFFSFFIAKIFNIASRCLEIGLSFPGLLSYFIGCLFSLQIAINVGVTTGVLPTKGLTLPFISYGGNSIVVSLLLVGIVIRSLKELETYDQN